MAGKIRISQAGLSAGVVGRSRTDGLDTGALVTIENTGTGSTTLFRLSWVPMGDTTAVASLAVTGAPKVWTFSPTASRYGSFRIDLIEDEGLATEYRETRIFGIRTPSAGLLIPAFNTRASKIASLINNGSDQVDASEDNSTDYAGALGAFDYTGWHRALHELIMAVDGGGGGGGAVTSVFGRTGAVVAALNDYTSSQVDNTSTVAAGAGTVTTALQSLASDIAAVAAAITGLGSDNVENDSAVDGGAGSVSDALDFLQTAITALSSAISALGSDDINNESNVDAGAGNVSDALDFLLALIGGLTSDDIDNSSGVDAGAGSVSDALDSLASDISVLQPATGNADGFLSRHVYADAASTRVGTTHLGVTVAAAPNWTTAAHIPPGDLFRFILYPPGVGGNGGGRADNAANAVVGGGTGGGGPRKERWMSRRQVIDALPILWTLPVGGTAGAGTTGVGGNPGSRGGAPSGPSSIGGLMICYPGGRGAPTALVTRQGGGGGGGEEGAGSDTAGTNGGLGGEPFGGLGAAGGNNPSLFGGGSGAGSGKGGNSRDGGSGGGSSGVATAPLAGGDSQRGSTGGGGGGGANAGHTVAFAGATGGACLDPPIAGAAHGQDGADCTLEHGGLGGGGGDCRVGAAAGQVGEEGGDGGFGGGAGGGGGAGASVAAGSNTGAPGGKGGDACGIVECYNA